jgi:PAS domain S-box-containing protein
MKSAPNSKPENFEISPLSAWSPLGQPIGKEFNNLLLLASQICRKPFATIIQPGDDHAFYSQKEIIIVTDTLSDKRFCHHPLVTAEPRIRFYAAVPLTTNDGILLGHLCVMDKKPGLLAEEQVSSLQTLVRVIVDLLLLKSQRKELRQREDPAEEGEELMATIFHDAIDAVVVLDAKGTILKWNPKAESVFGWQGEEVIGQSFYDTVIPVRHHEGILSLLANHTGDREGSVQNTAIEIQGCRKDLSEFDIALSISPATIRGRRFYICFASDITDRKLVAEKLDRQQAFYENILNKLPTDIAVFDAEHKYLFVNPGAISKEEYRKFIIGKDDYEYAQYRNRDIAVAHSRRAKFLEVKNTGKEIRWEDSLPDPRGNIITHLRRMYPVYDEKGQLSLVIGFGIDITDRKIMEEKQAALVKQLSAQNTQLIDFCSIVSHNLRAPLVNMSMLTDFIETSDDPVEQKLLISKLRPVIDTLHATFNELVESIQIKQDLEVQTEDVCLKDCIKRTIDGLQTEISKLDAQIGVDFDEVSIINYPPQYLNSIVHNLVSNSLKYHSPDRKPVILLKTKKVKDKVILSVSDNGLGIDLVKHRENFFKIGKVFHRHPNAKGFGLYMTKTHVEAMGGKIWVESIPDKGSVFFIEFDNQKRQAQ